MLGRSFRWALVLIASVAICFASCSDDDSKNVPIKVKVGANKAAVYTEEQMPVTAELEWVEASQGRTVNYVWSASNSEVVDVQGDGQTAWVTGVASGNVKIRLVAEVYDAEGRKTSTASDDMLVSVIPRLSPKVEGTQPAMTFLPPAVRAQIATAGDAQWSSSNENIATVEPDTGAITVISSGSTDITATYAQNMQASFRLDVSTPVEGIVLEPASGTVQAGGSIVFKAKVVPEDADDQMIYWAGLENGFASLTMGENGTVEINGIRPGTDTLTAMSRDGGFTASASIEVIDTIKVSQVTLDPQSLSLRNGQSATIRASYAPDNALNKSVIWVSSDPDVVQIAPDGDSCVVTVLKLPEGDSNYFVSAISPDGPSAKCAVRIVRKAVESVTVSGVQDVLGEGESGQLSALLDPADADDLSVTWFSAAPDIVSVDDEGGIEVLRLPEPGEPNPVIITARASSGVEGSIPIAIDVPLLGITIEGEDSFVWNESSQLTVSYIPANTTRNREVTWSSTNSSILVDNGLLTSVSPVSSVVTAVSVEDGSLSSSITVHSVKASSVTIDGDRNIKVLKGADKQMSAQVVAEPDGELADGRFLIPVWSVLDSSVASISESGCLTGVSAGTTSVKASAPVDSSVSDNVSLTVIDVSDVSLPVHELSIMSGDEQDISEGAFVTVLPDDENLKGIVWTSDNESVVTVENGLLRAVGSGIANITASSAEDPSVYDMCTVGVGIKVVSVRLSRAITVPYGTTGEIDAFVEVLPEVDSNKILRWYSGDEEIASVDNGVVTGEGLGSTIVTAFSSIDSSKFGTCLVNVIPNVSNLSFSAESYPTVMGSSIVLHPSITVSPNDTQYKKLSWTSLNTSVARVDDQGVVIPQGVGEATIVVTSQSDPTKTASCKVVVSATVEGVSIVQPNFEYVSAGSQFTMQANVRSNPNVSDYKGVTWMSENTQIATIDPVSGTAINALKPGEVWIRVTSDYDTAKYDRYKVFVKVGLSVPASETVYMREPKAIAAEIIPSAAEYAGVSWMSSDTSVATIDANGVVTPVAPGTTVISAISAYDPSVYAQCVVTVKYPPYVSFTSDGPFSIANNRGSKRWDGVLEYCTSGNPDDSSSWTEWDGTAIQSGSGCRILIRGTGNHALNRYNDSGSYWLLTPEDPDGKIRAFGDLCMLMNYATGSYGTLNNYAFSYLFSDCSALEEAPVLSLTSLTYGCYARMFRNCTSLIEAPVLPATTLAESCYWDMFSGCTSLSEAPVLPATVMRSSCYSGMFRNCDSFTTAPELPSTTLASLCYESMFSGCDNIVTAPVLPATTLAERCYEQMFNNCKSLVNAPALPATVVPNQAYYCMFAYCSALTTPPALPATQVGRTSYDSMFMSCTSLTSVPALPATVIDERSYYIMFNGCTSLKVYSTPAEDRTPFLILPDTLPTNAVDSMFYRSIGGVATPVAGGVYYSDSVIGSLGDISVGFSEDSATVYLNGTKELSAQTTLNGSAFGGVTWTSSDESVATVENGVVTGVSIGTVTITATSINCPSVSATCTVTIKYPPYVSFTSNGQFSITANAGKTWNGTLEYCTSGNPEEAGSWTVWNGSEIASGDGCAILVRGTGNQRISSTGSSSQCWWVITPADANGKVYASGDIRTLLNYANPASASMNTYCFSKMFQGQTALASAPALPSTSLSSDAYYYMFDGCTSLTKAPDLPALTVPSDAYCCMFRGCTSLTEAPVISATRVDGTGCYSMFKDCTSLASSPDLSVMTMGQGALSWMFYGCTSLTAAPALPATTLSNSCYRYLFRNCTSLTVAPELPATTMAQSCYDGMFGGCSSLVNAPTLPATTLAQECYYGMFSTCTSMTVAPALPATTLVSYCYQGMFSSCSALVQAPELPATTLASYCYSRMFSGCTSLVVAPELPATTLAAECYGEMFGNCTSLTHAPALPATTLADRCYQYMFYKCSALKVYDAPAAGRTQFFACPSELGTNSVKNMLTDTDGSYKSDPVANGAYYCENVVGSLN